MSIDGMVGENSQAAETRHAAMLNADAAATRQGNLVLGIFAGTVVFIAAAVFVSSRPAAISLSSTKLRVSAAGFSANVQRADIDSVALVTQLSGLGSKQNGFQWGSSYAGRFAMRPFGSARLFVNATKPPYVVVYAKSGVVFVNDRDSAATRRLFVELTSHASAAAAPR